MEVCLYSQDGWKKVPASKFLCWFVQLFLCNGYSQNSPCIFIPHIHPPLPQHRLILQLEDLSVYISHILDKATEM